MMHILQARVLCITISAYQWRWESSVHSTCSWVL